MGFTKNNSYDTLEYIVEEEDFLKYQNKIQAFKESSGVNSNTAVSCDIELNDFLKEIIGVSTNQIRDFKRHKVLKVNEMKMSLSAKVRIGDVIKAKFIEPAHMIFPEDIPISICYEDMDVVCVNKDKEMVAHPTKGHPEHTMSNALRFYGLSKGEDYKPRLINRLDMNTTGIIVFGKNPYSQHHISEQMQDNSIKKSYLAIVQGRLKEAQGTIDNYIYKTDDGIKRAVSDSKEGKRCITQYQVVEEFQDYSLIELNLITGRTHQIRVHMSHLGHPIMGDFLYGADVALAQKYEIERQLLHSHKLFFHSPRNGDVQVIAQPPEDMQKLLKIKK